MHKNVVALVLGFILAVVGPAAGAAILGLSGPVGALAGLAAVLIAAVAGGALAARDANRGGR